MDYKKAADSIVSLVGGEANIQDATNCMTRLRFMLKDNNLINMEQLKKTDGVIGAQIKSGQLQIIIGPEVKSIFEALPKGVREKEEASARPVDENIFNRMLSTFAGFFYPLIIVLGGAGIIKGFLALAANMGWIGMESDVYTVLTIISDGAFTFMPFFLAVTVAERIKVNKYLSLALAGMLLAPQLLAGAAEGAASLSFFGLPIPQFSYTSSVIPIILGVILLKYVFGFFSKYIPKSLELLVTSALSLIIAGVIMLVVLAPLGMYIGNYLSAFFVWFYDVAGPFASAILAGVFPFLVITGMAYAFFPVVFANMGALGYDFIQLPIMIFANVNMGIAALAVAIKTKDKKLRSLAAGSGLTAILGITEPAMYAVNLRYKRPFFCVLAGNVVAGALSGILGVKMFGVAGGGILAFPAFSGVDFPSNLMNATICLVVGAITTFVLTYLFTPRAILAEERGQ